jgi:riboflavin biosynthesis pyrimidine reductase
MSHRLQRLVPAPAAETTLREAYDVARPSPAGRPWIGLCMVMSLDGSVVVDHGSAALGNATDGEVLRTLRSIADMILVGAGTVRDEGYGAPSKQGQRIGVVTNSGSLDLDTEIFTSGAGFLIAPESAAIDERRVEVLRSGTERLDLAGAIGRLREIAPDISFVQAEGGPVLNGALLDGDLLDEINLTVSPRMVGGDGPRLTSAADELVRDFDLAHLLVDDDGFLFGRWLHATPT